MGRTSRPLPYETTGRPYETTAPRPYETTAPPPLRDHLHGYGPLPRPVVEVEQHDLLPRAKREPAVDQGDRLRRPDQGRPQVGVGVGVVIEAVVRVVIDGRDQ